MNDEEILKELREIKDSVQDVRLQSDLNVIKSLLRQIFGVLVFIAGSLVFLYWK